MGLASCQLARREVMGRKNSGGLESPRADESMLTIDTQGYCPKQLVAPQSHNG